MNSLRAKQRVWLVIAVIPVVLTLLNLVFPVPLVGKKEAAVPLGLCLALGICGAMALEGRIQKEKIRTK